MKEADTYGQDVIPSEGDQIKAAIRKMFELRREGNKFTEENPMFARIRGVNRDLDPNAELVDLPLALWPHSDLPGAVVLRYII